jgi:hypothetical protein
MDSGFRRNDGVEEVRKVRERLRRVEATHSAGEPKRSAPNEIFFMLRLLA